MNRKLRAPRRRIAGAVTFAVAAAAAAGFAAPAPAFTTVHLAGYYGYTFGRGIDSCGGISETVFPQQRAVTAAATTMSRARDKAYEGYVQWIRMWPGVQWSSDGIRWSWDQTIWGPPQTVATHPPYNTYEGWPWQASFREWAYAVNAPGYYWRVVQVFYWYVYIDGSWRTIGEAWNVHNHAADYKGQGNAVLHLASDDQASCHLP